MLQKKTECAQHPLVQKNAQGTLQLGTGTNQFKTLKLNCRANTPFKARRLSEARLLSIIKRACTVAPQVEKAWPRPTAKALPARVPRIGAYKASFPRPIACGAGFSLWRCRVERAVRSHSLRAWAIGRGQMAIPSKECTLLSTIYNRLW